MNNQNDCKRGGRAFIFKPALLTSPLWLCSYYPLYPPVEDMNMDYEKFQSYGQMPLTPDVLVVPSELRYFIKVQADAPIGRLAETIDLR